MSFGFVIGNGESRLSVPATMYQHKDTWACNLAYKQFSPKNLICCDRHILVQAIGDNAKGQIWTRKRWFSSMELPNVQHLPDLPYQGIHKFDQHMNWGSGTYAAYLACMSDHDILVFIGFDLWGKDNRINNVFKGEKGYGPKDSGPVGPQAWIHQIDKLMEIYTNKQFVFLNDKGWEPPESWLARDNFNHDLLRQLNNL